ncbi:MAG: DUF1573 domain-containing protein [Acidobacteriota bacterium]
MNATEYPKPELRLCLFMGLALLISVLAMPVAAQKATSQPGPKIVFSPEKMDLGKIPQQTRKSFDLTILNHGDQDLVIESVAASCGCTTGSVSDRVVKPGGSSKVQVTFNSGSFSGTVEKSVVVSSNDSKQPVKEFRFTAFVVPAQ